MHQYLLYQLDFYQITKSNSIKNISYCLEFVQLDVGVNIDTLFSQVFKESFFSSFTVIVNRGLLAALGVELNGGETLNANTFNFIGSGVHLSDNNILVVLKLGGKGSIDGSKGLAMATPGSVVFNEDVLVVVKDNTVEVLSDDNLDVFFMMVREPFQT